MIKKKVIIVDDEPAARQIIREYLSNYIDEYVIVAECCNGLEAIRDINAYNPDVVFLDIQMPVKNGFQVLQEIDVFPKIVFSTAFDQYAIKAFELSAIDYLLKPYDRSRFDTTLKKINSADISGITALYQHLPDSKTYLNRIFIESGNRLINLKVDDIIYLKAEREYCKVHTAEGIMLSSYGIGYMESVLDPQVFVRVHRSYIINIRFADEIYKDVYKTFIKLSNNHEVSVGRNYLQRVRRFIF